MGEWTYDAIVIGAGHNGLTLAAYLGRAGLKTLVLERRHEEGGGVNTEEPVMPGFRHNMHAQYMEFFDGMPIIQDFKLYELGLRSYMPEAQAGITFSDGRPPIIIHRPDLLDRTHKNISRYSTSDADMYVELKKKAMALEPLLMANLYTPPPAGGMPDQGPLLEALFGDLGITSDFLLKSPKVIIDELFETSELRALMYRACVEWGFPVDTAASGGAFLTFIMWTMGNWKLARGGTHTLAKSMTQACYQQGVDLIESSPVVKIMVDDNRVTGVKCANGDIYWANKLVASNADLKQTLLELVGENNLSPTWVRRAKAFRYGPSHVLGTLALCLHDPPDYKSARYDEEINRCFYTMVGFDGEEDTIMYIRDAYNGRLPKPAAGTWVNTIWDKTQAPPGKHSATGWYFMPPKSALTPSEWEDVRQTYNSLFIKVWRDSAPNMTDSNIIAERIYTPDQMERKNLMREGDFSNGEFSPDQMGSNRPFPEASRYKTEIDGLYLCGPSAYPGGGVHSACGNNAFKVIAEDFDLESPVVASRGY
ncbi:MAG: NAD(P)/FAD-dependent oxidoreductase [Acidimicrobiales bacterium]|nr:NAD(P)/FAD-dependent oxidoreductase [Acidimicrobiales bacterium]